tara:strand:+ start:284 stop:586 length:303 start_codon:yes stop_codon:yes gene_type:complete
VKNIKKNAFIIKLSIIAISSVIILLVIKSGLLEDVVKEKINEQVQEAKEKVEQKKEEIKQKVEEKKEKVESEVEKVKNKIEDKKKQLEDEVKEKLKDFRF